ncbi:MAG: preprotein translocase subunit YajC [Candidatus Omnitrophica bacterium]|nr:preprotein translocase subunit YajC [Candidatus Omnitrophota bacterium]
MAAEQAPSLFASPLFPAFIILVIWYFLMIKPEKEKQKRVKDMKENLKKNDQVVTAGGIHGTVVNVKEKTVIVRVDDSVKIEFDKDSISTVEKSKT